ncbi:MAG: hypothetical protein GX606_02960 [Elusimicrobia bacterium]|nr:hypothetical protein [Elusimicrobiota bacterium]
MNWQQAWEQALKRTTIVRSRIASLNTFSETAVPYVMLSASQVNDGDTVVRRGEVVVQKPSLILPPNIPQFEGFEFQKEEGEADGSVMSYLLIRGISIPSMRYNNKTYSLDVFEGGVDRAVAHFANLMERKEDVQTGLLAGPDDAWQLSVLIFVCSQIARNTQVDLKRLMDEYRKGHL